MPHAETLIRTVPGVGRGIGRSTISNGRFGLGICATRIVVMGVSSVFLLIRNSRFDERQQVCVNSAGLSRGHAVRKTLVGFQRAVRVHDCEILTFSADLKIGQWTEAV